MKNILLILFAFFAVPGVKGQHVKKISGVPSTLNNQNPNKFILEDEFVKITLNKGSGWQIDLDIFNKTDESIDLIWDDTYYVLSGTTSKVDNAGVSKIALGAFHTTAVDNMKPQKIGPKSKITAKIKSFKNVFDGFGANAHYKKTGEILVNKVIPVLLIDSVIKEYPITIELYSKKSLSKATN